jgi:hypothetical protein
VNLRKTKVVLGGIRTRLACLGAAVVLLGACSAPANDPFETIQEPASDLFANDKTAYDFFAGKGLTNFQAAGAVGNLDQESGVNPTISQGGGGPGRGIAQWSTGGRWDTTQGDNLVAYAAMQGMPTSSLNVQLGFIWYELEMFPEYGLAQLRASTNLNDATQVFEDKFEGCVYANFPVCNLPQRVTYAKGILAAYGNDPVPHDGAPDGKATTDATADRATADSGPLMNDDAADATTSVPMPDAAPPPPQDGAPPGPTSDAGSAGDAAEGVHSPVNINESGCAMSSRGSEGSSGWWLVAMGLVVASARRRRFAARRVEN